MMEVNNRIDQLFAKAREENPRLTANKMLKNLHMKLSQEEGGSINNISTFKLLMMIGTISTITLSVFILATNVAETGPNYNEIIISSVYQEKDVTVSDPIKVSESSAQPTFLERPKETAIPSPLKEVSESDFPELKEARDNKPTERPSFEGKGHKEKKSLASATDSAFDGDASESRIFLIDKTTRSIQFDIMKREAKKAGISFEYKTRGDGSLKKLHMLIKTETSTTSHKLVIDREDKIQIGWIVDKKNNSVRFYNRKDEIKRISEEQKIQLDTITMEIIDFEKKVIKESQECLMGK